MKVNDVPVLNYVVLALHSHFARIFAATLAAVLDIVVIIDHFCADEAFGNVAVDATCGLRSGPAFWNSPGSHFFWTSCEISY